MSRSSSSMSPEMVWKAYLVCLFSIVFGNDSAASSPYGVCYIKKGVGAAEYYLALRLWTAYRMIINNSFTPKYAIVYNDMKRMLFISHPDEIVQISMQEKYV